MEKINFIQSGIEENKHFCLVNDMIVSSSSNVTDMDKTVCLFSKLVSKHDFLKTKLKLKICLIL